MSPTPIGLHVGLRVITPRAGRPLSAAASRGWAVVRRRHVRRLELEALEDRVALSTIMITGLGDSGPGTLRAAIEQADLDPAADTITFAPGLAGTIALTSALPDLAGTLTLDGPGAPLLIVARSGASGVPGFRIFHVPVGGDVAISGMTVTGGTADSGGGILNEGRLTITGSSIRANTATVENTSVRVAASGAGIFNAGTLVVRASTISDNDATTGDFGISLGGGVANSGTLTVVDSTVSANSASSAIFGSAYGGGLYSTGRLTVVNSTLSRNRASASGAMIFDNGLGGAIATRFNGALTIIDSTVSDNRAGEGNGLFGRITALATIFGEGGEFRIVAPSQFTSLGHNLFTNKPPITFQPTDLVNTDPRLGPLLDNGGPTLTRALLPGSPALDAGVSIPGLTTDQRGIARPQGIAPDIGAFERELSPPVVVSVRRSGVHRQPTHVTLTFSEPLDPASATNRANYALVRVGPNGRTGAQSRPIRVDSVVYDAATRTVTITPGQRLGLNDFYRLTVRGKGAGAVASADGTPLDGAGTGRPGSDFVVVVHGFAPYTKAQAHALRAGSSLSAKRGRSGDG